jgi:glycosyltransferase involved in cell wall biosynthesis
VFPSYAEAFAVAPLESMACECPTIYSRRGSGPELLTDGKEGLLVDPDKPEEIAAAMVRVLHDDNFARNLGQAARAHVIEKFSTRTLVSQNVEAYTQALEQFHAAQRPRAAIAI